MSALHRSWLDDEARRTIVAPELRHVDDPAITRCAITANGTAIGRSYSRVSRDPGSVTGPYRAKPRLRVRVLGWLGSMRALLIGVGIGAAFVLLSACTGPTDAEALRDAALDLQDAQQQARAERRGEIHQAQELAMLAASGRK